MYIAGAIAYKIKLKIKCNECFLGLIDVDGSYEIDDINEDDYFKALDRGGLQRPSLFLYSMVKICLNFFELYIRPAIGMTIKNPSSPRLSELLFAFLQCVSFLNKLSPVRDATPIKLIFALLKL